MQEEDAAGMFELNQAEDVFRNTGDKPFDNIEEAINLIRNYDQFTKYRMGRFSMIKKETNEYIGWCGLKYIESTKETDLGYRVLPQHRAKGLATEASVLCLHYGFETLNIEKIIGRATKTNLPSIAILEKIGMKFEKTFIDHDTTCVQYQMNKSEWINRKALNVSNQKTNSKPAIG